MRGSAVILLLIGVFALVFAPAVFAQQADTPPKPAAGPAPVSEGETPVKDTPPATPKPKAGDKTVQGEVAGMDMAAKTLTVKGKKGEWTFDVSKAKWQGYMSMDEVTAGDMVRVTFREKEGKKMASNVYKRTGPTKPADTAPAK